MCVFLNFSSKFEFPNYEVFKTCFKFTRKASTILTGNNCEVPRFYYLPFSFILQYFCFDILVPGIVTKVTGLLHLNTTILTLTRRKIWNVPWFCFSVFPLIVAILFKVDQLDELVHENIVPPFLMSWVLGIFGYPLMLLFTPFHSVAA